jgi:hypothetical protein
VKNVFERTLKEVVMAYYKALFQHLPVRREETLEQPKPGSHNLLGPSEEKHAKDTELLGFRTLSIVRIGPVIEVSSF